MRNFTSDRGNQIVLGTYIATFTYALMVLRQIRTDSDTQEGFVPALSISMSIVLALVSVGLLVYFIHHVVQSIQVTTILNSVRTDMDNELKIMFPGEFGSAVGDGRSFKNFLEETAIWQYSCPAVVTSQKQGYLRRLDEESIDAFAQGRVSLVVVTPCIGDYIPRGGN